MQYGPMFIFTNLCFLFVLTNASYVMDAYRLLQMDFEKQPFGSQTVRLSQVIKINKYEMNFN